MWIMDYITRNSITENAAEQGDVLGSDRGKMEVSASSEFNKLPLAAPYGIASVSPEGERSVVLNASGESVSVGVIAADMNLKPGEIMLFSKGGATIKLSNDGNVYVNGTAI